jgi:nucleotide-binding universal stress UspA family protein
LISPILPSNDQVFILCSGITVIEMEPCKRILVGVDGSFCSNLAENFALSLAGRIPGSHLFGCHVYAAGLHRTRFGDMEDGLPDQYQAEERLSALRSTHDELISSGMKIISDAYLTPLADEAEKREIKFTGLTPEGRHYVRLLDTLNTEKPDLLIVGATGLGEEQGTLLGSVAERIVIHGGSTDVLVMRDPCDPENRPVIVGIDGSPESYAALARATELGKILGAPVEAVAVYDPYFHAGVFRTIAAKLPEEARKKFNFPAQEQLHDQIIDKGLEQLYEQKLQTGKEWAKQNGLDIRTTLLKGKVFPEICDYARSAGAGLIVVGRFGNHRENISMIGSNALNLSRRAPANVLVVAPPKQPLVLPGPRTVEAGIPWTPEAEELLKRVPSFAQGMARHAIEENVRALGGVLVTPDAVHEMGTKMGMQSRTGEKTGVPPEAELVVLKKTKRFAPDFHRHIVRPKLTGRTVRKGDRFMMYEVEETSPPGNVRVVEKTRIEFT